MLPRRLRTERRHFSNTPSRVCISLFAQCCSIFTWVELMWVHQAFSGWRTVFAAEIFGFYQKMLSLIFKFSVITGTWPMGQSSSRTAAVTVEILRRPTSAGAKLRVTAAHSRAHEQHKHQDKYLSTKISCLCAYFANPS